MNRSKLHQKILWIAETAILLALLVTLQCLTKPLGQLVTGSCVNAVLAVAALVAGPASGIVIALVSPVLAYLLNIAPQILVVPAIMIGNLVYVVLLHLIAGGKGRKFWHLIAAWAVAAVGKFGALYALVAWVICGLLSQTLLDAGVMKPPMLTALPATFGVMQLFTALIGGAAAVAVVPLVKKALKRD